jgi:hypothetical protein
MKKILILVLIAGLVSCENAGEVKLDLESAKSKADTLVNRVENSRTVDSIKSKGGKILDSVKSKSSRLMNKAEDEINNAKRDSGS